MSNKKETVAGVGRPYTAKDLGWILCKYIEDGDFENKANLDYFSPFGPDEDKEITREDFTAYALTKFGSNEGIYTSFEIEYRLFPDYKIERITLLVAKTLGESEQDFVNMSEMGARVCYKFNKFVSSDLDRFIWHGYDLSYTDESGKEVKYLWTGTMERFAYNAREIIKEHPGARIFCTDKRTGKKTEYKV